MEIIKLPEGEIAPPDTDCIKISRTSGGDYEMVASALMRCGDGESFESVALVSGKTYASYDDAEGAGLAWAEDQCVETLYVETGEAKSGQTNDSSG